LTTTLEKLKALDAQRATLLEDAKKEALKNAEKAVAELNELGFHYTLTERHHIHPNPTSAAQTFASNEAPSQRPALPNLPFQNNPAS
jgi:hypothetical protein